MTDKPAGRGLSKDEMDAFLRGSVISRIATVKPDGAPYVVPVWHFWDGGFLWVIPRERSSFVENIKREPRVCVSAADDVDPLHTRVVIQGRAEVVEGPVRMQGRMLEIANDMAHRYMGPDGPRYLARTADRPRYLLKITPEKTASWRGNEWHPRYVRG
jgi:PPOX class probable F420-dependent enzyme